MRWLLLVRGVGSRSADGGIVVESEREGSERGLGASRLGWVCWPEQALGQTLVLLKTKENAPLIAWTLGNAFWLKAVPAHLPGAAALNEPPSTRGALAAAAAAVAAAAVAAACLPATKAPVSTALHACVGRLSMNGAGPLMPRLGADCSQEKALRGRCKGKARHPRSHHQDRRLLGMRQW